MLKSAAAETLMQDAHAMHSAAVRTYAAGDWRHAAEKGWHAVRNATAALVLESTGAHPPDSDAAGHAIRRLAFERGGLWKELLILYGQFAHNLLHETFYSGVYHDDIGDLLHEVADYLRRAAELAET